MLKRTSTLIAGIAAMSLVLSLGGCCKKLKIDDCCDDCKADIPCTTQPCPCGTTPVTKVSKKNIGECKEKTVCK